jgi:hypothetical protein
MVRIFKIRNVLKATLNRLKVENITDELTVFRVGTGDIPDMSIFGAGGMGIMRFVAGYVLYGMIMFWFGPERFEWVSVWGFKNYHTFSVVICLFCMITNWKSRWIIILFVSVYVIYYCVAYGYVEVLV